MLKAIDILFISLENGSLVTVGTYLSIFNFLEERGDLTDDTKLIVQTIAQDLSRMPMRQIFSTIDTDNFEKEMQDILRRIQDDIKINSSEEFN